MELQDTTTMEHRQQQYGLGGRGFMARKLETMMDHLRGVETTVNTSTFGRVFRLGGSGHVSRHTPSSCRVQLLSFSIPLSLPLSLIPYSG